MKRGKLYSGRSGKKVTSRKRAIAIGLSEARRSGTRVTTPRNRRESTGQERAQFSASWGCHYSLTVRRARYLAEPSVSKRERVSTEQDGKSAESSHTGDDPVQHSRPDTSS